MFYVNNLLVIGLGLLLEIGRQLKYILDVEQSKSITKIYIELILDAEQSKYIEPMAGTSDISIDDI